MALATKTPLPLAPAGPVAETARALVEAMAGRNVPVRFAFWDGSSVGPDDGPGTVVVRSVDAIRRIVWSPDELGLARAYVAGDIVIEGDMFGVLCALRDATRHNVRGALKAVPAAVSAAKQLRALRSPPPPPPEEARTRGLRHSKRRDAQTIAHHYDVGSDFYEIVLGPSMTYSCARFTEPDTTLVEAQAAKHELICRKLGLDERPGARLLDVGCGWGSLAIHAAEHHGASVVGITISEAQALMARERVRDAGLADRVEIRLQDYRDVRNETFDAISSVGMFEHVGAARIGQYFETLRALLVPRGRFLNHAISSVHGSKLGGRSFMGRYVFPDGELIDVGEVVQAMEKSGLEVRDVESLREHYATTLRAWVANLEAGWDRAVELVGDARARIWQLYMTGSAIGFEDGGIAIHQVLGVAPDANGGSGMPRTRRGFG